MILVNVKTRRATRAALRYMRTQQAPGSRPAQWDHPHPPLLFWRAFVAAGGLDLDPSIWHLDQGGAAGVALCVETAILSGASASQACATFFWHTPQRHEWLRVDDGYEVVPCVYLIEYLTDLFVNMLNRSLLAIQVLQGIADLEELDQLDTIKPPPDCFEDSD